MKFPQVLVYERDGRLAGSLRELTRERQWALKEVRRWESVRELLRVGPAAVVVCRIGRDLAAEFAVLEKVHGEFPEAAVLVVSDSADPAVVHLAWTVGAGFVLCPPQSVQEVPALVAGLMAGVLSRSSEP